MNVSTSQYHKRFREDALRFKMDEYDLEHLSLEFGESLHICIANWTGLH
jgi:hypothetical protein